MDEYICTCGMGLPCRKHHPPRVIHVWPDGAWCWPDELEPMLHGRSDDYATLEVSDDCTEEDAERIADMEATQQEQALRAIFESGF